MYKKVYKVYKIGSGKFYTTLNTAHVPGTVHVGFSQRDSVLPTVHFYVTRILI